MADIGKQDPSNFAVAQRASFRVGSFCVCGSTRCEPVDHFRLRQCSGMSPEPYALADGCRS